MITDTEADERLLAQAFVNWVGRQDRTAEYCYMHVRRCAYALFLKETGRAKDPWVGGTDWYERGNPKNPHLIPRELRSPLHEGEQTFGALADRLASIGLVVSE